MKRCTRCGVEKPLNEFPPVRRGEPKLQSWCRACFAQVNAAYYARNREREKARLVAQTNARRDENRRDIVAYLLVHPCIDCGETDIVVLEFDHREEKRGDVSTYANGGRTWRRVLQEISKCDVRCANCHRRMTARRAAARASRAQSSSRQRRAAVQLDLRSAVDRQRCRVCAQEKPLAEFGLRSIATRTHHHICLECQRAVTKLLYATRRGGPVHAIRKRGTARRDVLAQYVFSYLTDHPCVDRKQSDPLVLEFDHRRTKTANVSDLVRSAASLSEMVAEIEKCEVRCANCHRRRTVMEIGGYRLGA